MKLGALEKTSSIIVKLHIHRPIISADFVLAAFSMADFAIAGKI